MPNACLAVPDVILFDVPPMQTGFKALTAEGRSALASALGALGALTDGPHYVLSEYHAFSLLALLDADFPALVVAPS